MALRELSCNCLQQAATAGGGQQLYWFLYSPLCSFFPGSEALLASTARDGQLIVWRISEAGDGSLTGQQALALQLPVPQAGGASVRLAWHPACQDVLFFTAGARVLAAHISELTASAQQVL